MEKSPLKRLHILLVDDDEEEFLLTRDLLADRSYLSKESSPIGFKLDWVATYDAALDAFQRDLHDVYLVDYHLGGRDGLQLLREVTAYGCTKPIILMTGRGSYEVDLEAMKAGATDYLTKGELSAPLLERTIRYALERKRAEQEIRRNAARAHALARLSQAFAGATLDYPALLKLITQRIANALEDGCIMRIVSEDKKALVPVSIHLPVNGACCLEEENRSSELSGDGLAEAVFSTGQPQLLQSRPAVEALEASLQDNGETAQSLMIVPLRAQGRSLGTLSALRFHKDRPYTEDDLVFFQDIAGRAALAIENALLHSEVQRLAITDALTEVYNRRGLFELGRREIERSRRFKRPLSVIMVDLDKFKDVNDTYGHAAGDQVLRAVARRLSDSLREVDMIGRYGGDEFIILLPETDLYTACAVAERIRQRVTHPITVGALPFGEIALHLTASLGVSSLSADPQDLAGLIDRADAASYRAKHNGRNNIQIG